MRLGRNFTNLLYFEYLTPEDQRKLEEGELLVADMDALVQVKAKGDIVRQVLVAKSLGLDHVELDGAVPNPYLRFSTTAKEETMGAARKAGITLSLHMPYSYISAALCAPDELDRRAAVELQRRYLEFASSVGCEYCVLHPGVTPFYHANGKYFEQVRSSLIKSLLELGEAASKLGLTLHLENNTAFENVFTEPEGVCAVLEEVRENGVEIYFCFDIGHWLTRIDVGKKTPNPPELVIEEIPSGFFKEIHLNDYVPGKRIFHPPLQEGAGVLKRENLKRYFEFVGAKGAELVVVETAFKVKEQVMRREQIMREETEYLRSLVG